MNPAPINHSSEFHLEIAEDNSNAVNQLAKTTQLSKQAIKQAMQKGAVWHTRNGNTQRLRRASKSVSSGDQLHLYYNKKILSSVAPEPRLVVDEQCYSVWYKPYGMYCQGTKWGDHCTITRWIEQHSQRPTYIVHRLDRAATGLVIVAHQKKVTTALARLFEQRKIIKKYQAIVHGDFPESDLPTMIEQEIDDRRAISHVKRLRYSSETDQTLLEVTIETGRKHQIRRHLAGIGYPIVGDRLYGKGDTDQDLQLCSCYLAFNSPITCEEKNYCLDQSMRPQL